MRYLLLHSKDPLGHLSLDAKVTSITKRATHIINYLEACNGPQARLNPYHEICRCPICSCSISLIFFLIANFKSLTVAAFDNATSFTGTKKEADM
jgi:hypothetical protein